MNKLIITLQVIIIFIVLSPFAFAEEDMSDQDLFEIDPQEYIRNINPDASIELTGKIEGVKAQGSRLTNKGESIDLQKFDSDLEIEALEDGGFEIKLNNQNFKMTPDNPLPDGASVQAEGDLLAVEFDGNHYEMSNLDDYDISFDKAGRLILVDNDNRRTIVAREGYSDGLVDFRADGGIIKASEGIYVGHEFDNNNFFTTNTKGDTTVDIGEEFSAEGEFKLSFTDGENRWLVENFEGEETSFVHSEGTLAEDAASLVNGRGSVWNGEKIISVGRTNTLMQNDDETVTVNSEYDYVSSAIDNDGIDIISYPSELDYINPVEDEEHEAYGKIRRIDNLINEKSQEIEELEEERSDYGRFSSEGRALRDEIAIIEHEVDLLKDEREDTIDAGATLINTNFVSKNIASLNRIGVKDGEKFIRTDKVRTGDRNLDDSHIDFKLGDWRIKSEDGDSSSELVHIDNGDEGVKFRTENSLETTVENGIHTARLDIQKHTTIRLVGETDVSLGDLVLESDENSVHMHHRVDGISQGTKNERLMNRMKRGVMLAPEEKSGEALTGMIDQFVSAGMFHEDSARDVEQRVSERAGEFVEFIEGSKRYDSFDFQMHQDNGRLTGNVELRAEDFDGNVRSFSVEDIETASSFEQEMPDGTIQEVPIIEFIQSSIRKLHNNNPRNVLSDYLTDDEIVEFEESLD